MKKLVLSVLLLFSLLFVPASVGTAAFNPLSDACTGTAAGSSVCNDQTDNPLTGTDGTISKIAQLVVYATGIVSVLMIIIGGYTYVMSTGDPQKISAAKNTIIYAVIGLFVAVSAQVIIKFVLQNIG